MSLADLERLSPADWFFDVRDQLREHIYRRAERAFAAGDAARDALATPEQIVARQAQVRERFLASIAAETASNWPFDPQVVGEVRGDGFRIEKVLYQSRPHHTVTANLYIPDGLAGPSAAVLFLCGHHARAKHEPEYQRVCRTLCRAGLIVLAQDPIGQGERWSYWEPALQGCTIEPCCPEHDHAGAQCLPLGDALARYHLGDAMRSIDYLCTRPEVDPTRIGVTGNSGGGTQTCLMMLADPRIAAAAPATFVMNRETYMWTGGAQDAEQIWPGFTAAGHDHEDVLLCMAPKPVCVLAVTEDFFPIEGTRRTVERCRRIWRILGQPDALEYVEDESNHWFTPKLARAAALFFARRLLGATPTLPDDEPAAFEPSDLYCTRSGQVRGEIADAWFAYETNLERLEALEDAREQMESAARRQATAAFLRERIGRGRVACDLNPRVYSSTRWQDMAVAAAVWRTQPDLLGHGLLFRDALRAGESLPVTLAIWDEGTNRLQPHIDWISRTCRAGRAVLVLDTSGVGGLAPRPICGAPDLEFYGTLHKLADDLIWLDDDLVSLRTHDVLRAMELLPRMRGIDASDLAIRCEGRHGVYGRLAALLDPRLGRPQLGPGMATWRDWVAARLYDSRDIYSVILPGILRLCDLDDIDEWTGAVHAD